MATMQNAHSNEPKKSLPPIRKAGSIILLNSILFELEVVVETELQASEAVQVETESALCVAIITTYSYFP